MGTRVRPIAGFVLILLAAVSVVLAADKPGPITLTPTNLSLAVGESQPIKATGTVKLWSSSDTAVATLSAPGMVTGVGPGTATITAQNAKYRARTTVIVGTAIAAPCTYNVTPGSFYAGAPEANLTATVTASKTTCGWTASSPVSWVVLSKASGTGSSTVGVRVLENTGAARSATITVAGAQIGVQQEAATEGEPQPPLGSPSSVSLVGTVTGSMVENPTHVRFTPPSDYSTVTRMEMRAVRVSTGGALPTVSLGKPTPVDGVCQPAISTSGWIQGSEYRVEVRSVRDTITSNWVPSQQYGIVPFSEPPPPTSAHYYVATTGSDTNPGTITQPFRTINKGLSVISGGQTLRIRGGTYTEKIGSVKAGTASTRTTIEGYPGETVTLAPSLPGEFDRIINLSGTSSGTTNKYLTFKNLILDGNSAGQYGIAMENHSGGFVRLENVEIKRIAKSGIYVGPTDGGFNEFINVKSHHNGLVSGTSHGLYLQASNCVIDGGEWHTNGGYGIQAYTGFSGFRVDNTIIRNARVYNNDLQSASGGIAVWKGSNALVYNNVVYDNRQGITSSGDAINPRILNNTVYSNTGTGISVSSSVSGAVVRNNIVYANGAGITNSGSGTTRSHNLGQSGAEIVANPLFVNAASFDFHLQSGSPAVNAGMTIALVPVDHDGVTRPQGAAYDIGAYER